MNPDYTFFTNFLYTDPNNVFCYYKFLLESSQGKRDTENKFITPEMRKSGWLQVDRFLQEIYQRHEWSNKKDVKAKALDNKPSVFH